MATFIPPGQLSETVGCVSIEEVTVVTQPAPAGMICGAPEHVMVGGVFSRTSIVKVQVAELLGDALSHAV